MAATAFWWLSNANAVLVLRGETPALAAVYSA